MSKTNFWSGVRYVVGIVVFAALHYGLAHLIGTGWLTTGGEAVVTGAVGYVEAKLTGLGF